MLRQLGKNIHHERKRRGLTQEELAELADLHPRALQKVELAKNNVLATTLMRIQAALECPWDLLMPNLGKRENVKGWIRRMEETNDPDWLVFMQRARDAWEGRKKPSPGKIKI